MQKGDKILIGFDLKKSPEIIMQAYDDPYGQTKKFNLNHLARLNRELEADFDLSKFEHHTTYNPVSGYLKSYLVSKEQQTVNIKSLDNSLFLTGGNLYLWNFQENSISLQLKDLHSVMDSHCETFHRSKKLVHRFPLGQNIIFAYK